jgi:hypothetical protein
MPVHRLANLARRQPINTSPTGCPTPSWHGWSFSGGHLDIVELVGHILVGEGLITPDGRDLTADKAAYGYE